MASKHGSMIDADSFNQPRPCRACLSTYHVPYIPASRSSRSAARLRYTRLHHAQTAKERQLSMRDANSVDLSQNMGDC